MQAIRNLARTQGLTLERLSRTSANTHKTRLNQLCRLDNRAWTGAADTYRDNPHLKMQIIKRGNTIEGLVVFGIVNSPTLFSTASFVNALSGFIEGGRPGGQRAIIRENYNWAEIVYICGHPEILLPYAILTLQNNSTRNPKALLINVPHGRRNTAVMNLINEYGYRPALPIRRVGARFQTILRNDRTVTLDDIHIH